MGHAVLTLKVPGTHRHRTWLPSLTYSLVEEQQYSLVVCRHQNEVLWWPYGDPYRVDRCRERWSRCENGELSDLGYDD
jgi:hypothetical protein